MAETELQNRPGNMVADEGQPLSSRVAEQVSEILEEAVQREKVPQRVLAYRIPSPGVRYYF